MKKTLIISLFVLLTLGLFVSCKPEPEPEPEKAKMTFAEILEMADGGFPTSTDVAWKNDSSCKCCLGEYESAPGVLCLLFYVGDLQKQAFNVNINEASFQDGNYIYEDTTTIFETTTTTTIVFVIDNGILVKISYTSTGSSINGEYTAPSPV